MCRKYKNNLGLLGNNLALVDKGMSIKSEANLSYIVRMKVA